MLVRDGSLKAQLASALNRIQKTNWPAFCLEFDVTILSFMRSIAGNSPDSDSNVYMVDLQEQLFVSKAAISQMANLLEAKGYLKREIDKSNRRKLTITLTDEGRAALTQSEMEFDKILDDFMCRLGDEDAQETVRLFNRFAVIAEEISKNEGYKK